MQGRPAERAERLVAALAQHRGLRVLALCAKGVAVPAPDLKRRRPASTKTKPRGVIQTSLREKNYNVHSMMHTYTYVLVDGGRTKQWQHPEALHAAWERGFGFGALKGYLSTMPAGRRLPACLPTLPLEVV